jgi:hypothetical protein
LCDPVGKLYTEDNPRQLVRVLQYAAEYKSSSEPLAAFVQRKRGINKCAARFTRPLGVLLKLRPTGLGEEDWGP